MAEADLAESDQIRTFAKALRVVKNDIDKKFVQVSPVLDEVKYTKYAVERLDDCLKAVEDVLAAVNEISDTVVTIKGACQEAKIQALQKQLRMSQIREQSGRVKGKNNDSGIYSVDSRVLTDRSSTLVTQPCDTTEEDSIEQTSRPEPTQHEDTSKPRENHDDSIC